MTKKAEEKVIPSGIEDYPSHKEKCYKCGYEREAGFLRFEWTCPKCGEYNL